MTNDDALKLLEQRLTESGLTYKSFANDVIWRSELTLRRYRNGDTRIPPIVARNLSEARSGLWTELVR